MGLGTCEACGVRDAVFHVTVRVDVVGPRGVRVKLVQFALCEVCERGSQGVLMRDGDERARVAQRLCLVERVGWAAGVGRHAWRRR